MKSRTALLWGAAVIGVALFNIAGALPDWATYAAVFTLPMLAVTSCRKSCA